MQAPNPYEAPQGEVTLAPTSWRQNFAVLVQQPRVAWGATLCFWALAVYVVFGLGSTMMLLVTPREYDFYWPLIFWSTIVAAGLHFAGLLMLCQIGDNTGAKPWFQWACGFFAAVLLWNVIQYYEPLPVEGAAEIPPSVVLLVDVSGLATRLLLLTALLRVAQHTHDFRLRRWARWAWGLYAFVAVLSFLETSSYFYAQNLIYNLIFNPQAPNPHIPMAIRILQVLAVLPCIYCYGRCLRRMAALWEQLPAAELVVDDDSILFRSNHEPESV